MNYFSRKRILFLLALMAMGQFCMANEFNNNKYRKGRFVMGITFGAASYHGDLAQKYFNVNSTGPMVGIFSRYSLSPFFDWRNQLSFAQIQADDANSAFYKTRNLNFHTDIYEYSSIFEFNFFSYGINRPNNEFEFSPYAFLGVGAFYFDPMATYNNQEIGLRKLQTENKAYNPLQPQVPFGMGVKFAWTNRIEVGVEVGYRKLFTDYLDDVSGEYPSFAQLEADRGLAAAQASHAHTYDNSQIAAEPGSMRGDNHLTDTYLFGNITFTYRFFPKDDCNTY